MGLIYVNPEGPNGKPDPLAAARDIRETFAAHGDERRGDGRAHRRRAHVRQDPRRRRCGKYVGPEPEGASIEEQGFGWKNTFGSGKGVDAITSGLEGAWTTNPVKWDNNFFDNLFKLRVGADEEPRRRAQWTPKDAASRRAPCRMPTIRRSGTRR
jgi:catalase-peroxidase